MKIVALYKAFSGEEWIVPSVNSIYPFVDKIVILLSSRNWVGAEGNPCLSVVQAMVEKGFDKIIPLHSDETHQLKHCEEGYAYIKKNLPCDYVMLIDTDEVWDDTNLSAAIEDLKRHPGAKAFRTHMYTYVKSPFYRVDPIEPLKPVCFIRSDLNNMGLEPRGCGIHPFVQLDQYMHHFVFVRTHSNNVLEKLVTSHVSEKQPYRHILEDWAVNVWMKLPNCAPNFHPAIGFGHNWKGIKQIGRQDLPEVLRGGVPIIMKFDKGIQ